MTHQISEPHGYLLQSLDPVYVPPEGPTAGPSLLETFMGRFGSGMPGLLSVFQMLHAQLDPARYRRHPIYAPWAETAQMQDRSIIHELDSVIDIRPQDWNRPDMSALMQNIVVPGVIEAIQSHPNREVLMRRPTVVILEPAAEGNYRFYRGETLLSNANAEVSLGAGRIGARIGVSLLLEQAAKYGAWERVPRSTRADFVGVIGHELGHAMQGLADVYASRADALSFNTTLFQTPRSRPDTMRLAYQFQPVGMLMRLMSDVESGYLEPSDHPELGGLRLGGYPEQAMLQSFRRLGFSAEEIRNVTSQDPSTRVRTGLDLLYRMAGVPPESRKEGVRLFLEELATAPGGLADQQAAPAEEKKLRAVMATLSGLHGLSRAQLAARVGGQYTMEWQADRYTLATIDRSPYSRHELLDFNVGFVEDTSSGNEQDLSHEASQRIAESKLQRRPIDVIRDIYRSEDGYTHPLREFRSQVIQNWKAGRPLEPPSEVEQMMMHLGQVIGRVASLTEMDAMHVPHGDLSQLTMADLFASVLLAPAKAEGSFDTHARAVLRDLETDPSVRVGRWEESLPVFSRSVLRQLGIPEEPYTLRIGVERPFGREGSYAAQMVAQQMQRIDDELSAGGGPTDLGERLRLLRSMGMGRLFVKRLADLADLYRDFTYINLMDRQFGAIFGAHPADQPIMLVGAPVQKMGALALYLLHAAALEGNDPETMQIRSHLLEQAEMLMGELRSIRLSDVIPANRQGVLQGEIVTQSGFQDPLTRDDVIHQPKALIWFEGDRPRSVVVRSAGELQQQLEALPNPPIRLQYTYPPGRGVRTGGGGSQSLVTAARPVLSTMRTPISRHASSKGTPPESGAPPPVRMMPGRETERRPPPLRVVPADRIVRDRAIRTVPRLWVRKIPPKR